MIRAVETTETEYGTKVVLSSKKSDARDIKSLPWNATHRSWDPDAEHWTVDYKPEIVSYLEEIGCRNLGWLRDEFKEQLEEAEHFKKLSQATEDDFDVPAPEGLEYYPFQKAGVRYAVEKFENDEDGVLFADEMGCIAGDAELPVNRAGKGFTVTLREAYRRFNGKSRKNWNWDPDIPTFARSLMDGRIHLNEVKDILYKGEKQVYRLATRDGYEIKATADHEMRTPEGWVELQNLTAGDEVMVNGDEVCTRCGSTRGVITHDRAKFKGFCRTCMYDLRNNPRHVDTKFVDKDGYVRLRGPSYVDHHRYTTGGVYEHIVVAEKKLGRKIEDDEAVHHENGDRQDNRPENLRVMPAEEHMRKHGEEELYMNLEGGDNVTFAPTTSEITRIEAAGTMDVYDLVMADPHRNFVADGVIVHNCGKTIQAVGVLNHQGFDRAVIVCPASLKQNWKRELDKWLVDDAFVNVYDDGPLAADVEIVNYALFSSRERLPNRVNTYDPEYLILDESHYIKNKDANRTERIRKVKADRRIFLTGTPIKNRPIELWTQLNELTDEFEFWPYAKTYCGASKGRWGWDMSGATNLDELQERLRSSVMVRRQKQDVLTDLPEKMRQVIPLAQNGLGELVSKERELYDRHEDEIADAKARLAEAEVTDDEDQYERAIQDLRDAREIAFEEMAEVRHEIAVRKADHVIEHVRNILESEQKVVVFAHHKDVIKELESAFGSEAVSLTGDTPTHERQRAVDHFQNDPEVRVFVGSIHAAGTGITLTAASHVVFAELDWTPSVNRQAEDRCHRIGQDDTVHVQYLVVDGSLEARIAQTNVNKQRAIDAAMDDAFDDGYYEGDDVDVDLIPSGADDTLEDSVAPEHTEEIVETSDEEKRLILKGLQKLSRLCDGAKSLDGMGFNKADASFGQSLAANATLSDKQAHYGRKLIRKYSRQLDDDLVETVTN